MTLTLDLPFATVIASSGGQHNVPNTVAADIWRDWYSGRGVATKVVVHNPIRYDIDPEADRFALTNLLAAVVLTDEEVAEREQIAREVAAEIETNDELAMQAEVDAMEAQFEQADEARFTTDLVRGLIDCGIRELRGLAKGRFNSKTMGKAEVVANLVQAVEADSTNVNDILAAAGLPTYTDPD